MRTPCWWWGSGPKGSRPVGANPRHEPPATTASAGCWSSRMRPSSMSRQRRRHRVRCLHADRCARRATLPGRDRLATPRPCRRRPDRLGLLRLSDPRALRHAGRSGGDRPLAYRQLAREHYPRVRWREESVLARAGDGQRIVTAGGVTAWVLGTAGPGRTIIAVTSTTGLSTNSPHSAPTARSRSWRATSHDPAGVQLRRSKALPVQRCEKSG